MIRLSKAITAINKAFETRWGNKFSRKDAQLDAMKWESAIKGLKPSDIKRGINKLFTITNDWPISHVEFRFLALGITEGYQKKMLDLVLNWNGFTKVDNIHYRRAQYIRRALSKEGRWSEFKRAPELTVTGIIKEKLYRSTFKELESVALELEESITPPNLTKEGRESLRSAISELKKAI